MRAWFLFLRCAGAATIAVAVPAVAAGQVASPPAVPPAPAALSQVSMADAVRLALEHNHQLRAQRLNVDLSKADEITAALKPNPILTSTNENFPVFSPSQMFSRDNFANNQNFVESVSYLFERGGKREKRTLVAQDTTRSRRKRAVDAERQLAFDTEQAFINVLLAKSSLELAQREPRELLERGRREPRARARPGTSRKPSSSRSRCRSCSSSRMCHRRRSRSCRRRRRSGRTSVSKASPKNSTSTETWRTSSTP